MESLYEWDREVSKLVHSPIHKNPYSDLTEAHWRALYFDGGPSDRPLSPGIAQAFSAWQETLQCLVRHRHSRDFSSRVASFRTKCLISVNVMFTLLYAWLFYSGNLSLSSGLQCWLIWNAAYYTIRIVIKHVSLKMDPELIVDKAQFSSHLTHLSDLCKPFEQAFGLFCIGRRFCITQRGYLGWVSLTAREGDEIAAFRGTRTFFTFRRQEPAGYTLTGDCYLQGLMKRDDPSLDGSEQDIVIV